ncbi:ROK family protein [Dyella caseinilytica]|uniref:ROK family protein n=1 Tax=Dyella caseinilytica TaxID=1849581 RepID=A0ABX7GV68_9GAMM|nr:ROK family protein [Dyella caseinilytica]QRN54306.1 ROK family protein [Dyella caseinilytica]GFZ93172.1 glucokinase [Dyella caseinilytica]
MSRLAPLNSSTPSHGVLIAIDVGGTKTQIACYDTSTGQLNRTLLDTHAPGLTGAAALHRIIVAAKQCAQLDNVPHLRGVAAVFPGVVRDNHLLMAPNTPGLEGLDLYGQLAAAFATPVITLDNDVKAGALAEHTWGSLHGADHALYVNIGTGLSAAAIIHGEVYRGRNGAALEIGYQLTPFLDHLAPTDWRGLREGVAPMEAMFSGTSLDILARDLWGPERDARDLFRSTDPKATLELQRRLHALASQLVNLSIALDVERIAIGGGVSQQYPVLEPDLTKLLQRLVPFPPTLVSARFVNDAPLWGALELARRAAGTPALPSTMFEASSDDADRNEDPSPKGLHKATQYP